MFGSQNANRTNHKTKGLVHKTKGLVIKPRVASLLVLRPLDSLTQKRTGSTNFATRPVLGGAAKEHAGLSLGGAIAN